VLIQSSRWSALSQESQHKSGSFVAERADASECPEKLRGFKARLASRRLRVEPEPVPHRCFKTAAGKMQAQFDFVIDLMGRSAKSWRTPLLARTALGRRERNQAEEPDSIRLLASPLMERALHPNHEREQADCG
jgi:hypothetical protein